MRLNAAPSRFAGFFGWWIVAAAFVIYFMSAGLLGTGTVYFKPLSAEFGWHRGELSGAFSLGFLLAGAATPLWGRIADRRGPRAAFLPGVMLTGVICLLQSRIWNLTSLYIINVALAVAGAGVSLIPVSVILSNWFVRRRGRAIGIAYTGEGFGILILTPVVGMLVVSVGWRYAYILSGLAFLGVLMPVVVWIKNRPQDVGQSADGVPSPSPSARPSVEGIDTDARGLSLSEALRTSAFWVIALAWFVTMMPLAAEGLHQVPYLTDLGFSTASAALLAGAVGGMSILGRLGFGLLAERYPVRPIYVWCYVLAGIGAAALWAAARVGSVSLVVYVVFAGIANGGALALSALLVAECFGVRALGEIFGLLALAATIGGAVGGTAAGVLFDMTGSYDIAFGLGVVLCGAGCVLMALAKPPASRVAETKAVLPVLLPGP
ncbi:MAG: MFS transporter [Candidatus Binatia bacterium]